MGVIEILTAFLCAALSGMGVGGGGLLLIYIAMFTDTPQKEAQLYNLIFFMCASASALLLHVKKRRLDLRVISLLALSGVPGARRRCRRHDTRRLSVSFGRRVVFFTRKAKINLFRERILCNRIFTTRVFRDIMLSALGTGRGEDFTVRILSRDAI